MVDCRITANEDLEPVTIVPRTRTMSPTPTMTMGEGSERRGDQKRQQLIAVSFARRETN